MYISVMKTLFQKLLTVSASSSDDVAIVLSNFSNAGIILLEVSLDLAYFQNVFGLFLMLSKRFLSNSLLRFLVRERSLFLHLI